MKKMSEDLLMDMEDRRRIRIDQLNKDLSDWTDELDKASNEALSAAGDPEKADAYAAAQKKADVARGKINKLNCQIRLLQQRKLPIATPEETKEFYKCVYRESLEKIRGVAEAYFSYYQLCCDLTKEAKEIESKTIQLLQTWNNDISVVNQNSPVKFNITGSMTDRTKIDDTVVSEFHNAIGLIDNLLGNLSE